MNIIVDEAIISRLCATLYLSLRIVTATHTNQACVMELVEADKQSCRGEQN